MALLWRSVMMHQMLSLIECARLHQVPIYCMPSPSANGDVMSFCSFRDGYWTPPVLLPRSSLESVSCGPLLRRRPYPYAPVTHIVFLSSYRVSCCAAITQMPKARP